MGTTRARGRRLSRLLPAVALVLMGGAALAQPSPGERIAGAEPSVPAPLPSGAGVAPPPAPLPARRPPAALPAPRPLASPPAAPPVSPPASPVAASGAPDVEVWRDRVDHLILGMAAGRLSAVDADGLFWELDEVLWPFQRSVRRAIDAAEPDFIDRHTALVALYAERSRLFALISPALREQIAGLGRAGRSELRREVEYFSTTIRSQILALRDAARHLGDNVRKEPLQTAWRALQILLALGLFAAWRHWARRGLPETRSRLLRVRPRQPVNVRLANFLWYLDRTSGPLSWLLLVLCVDSVIRPRGFEELVALVMTVLVWTFAARLAVSLIDALAAHGVGGLRRERSGLRLRSLRLLAAWSLLLGLGLSLAGRYVGHGALYGWVVQIWQMLTVPVVLLLIHWWRDEIADRLEALAGDSGWARRLSGRRRGLISYPIAVAGAARLLWAAFVRRVLRLLSHWEWGRRVLAVLVRREVARELEQERYSEALPIAEDAVERLLAARDVVIDEIAESPLEILAASLSLGVGGGYVVLAERGGGKSVFLERLADCLDESTLVVSCPASGYPALASALAERLGVDASANPETALSEAIEASGVGVIAIDDAHFLSRPWMGGQEGFDRIAQLDACLRGGHHWVLAIDRRAWRYILRSRGERALFQRVFELPAWSEDQLAELVLRRSQAAGIDPDYSRLVLPRQLDAGEHDSIEERNRYGFARILWEIADGNPEIALRLFAGSLRRVDAGRPILQLPQPEFSVALNDANVETMLVLRTIVQCDVATVADVSKSLRISQARALAGLRFCLQNGWVEAVGDGYRVSWDDFRMITRALMRQNLVPR